MRNVGARRLNVPPKHAALGYGAWVIDTVLMGTAQIQSSLLAAGGVSSMGNPTVV